MFLTTTPSPPRPEEEDLLSFPGWPMAEDQPVDPFLRAKSTFEVRQIINYCMISVFKQERASILTFGLETLPAFLRAWVRLGYSLRDIRQELLNLKKKPPDLRPLEEADFEEGGLLREVKAYWVNLILDCFGWVILLRLELSTLGSDGEAMFDPNPAVDVWIESLRVIRTRTDLCSVCLNSPIPAFNRILDSYLGPFFTCIYDLPFKTCFHRVYLQLRIDADIDLLVDWWKRVPNWLLVQKQEAFTKLAEKCMDDASLNLEQQRLLFLEKSFQHCHLYEDLLGKLTPKAQPPPPPTVREDSIGIKNGQLPPSSARKSVGNKRRRDSSIKGTPLRKSTRTARFSSLPSIDQVVVFRTPDHT